MFKINPLLCTDGYKTSHRQMYPEGTELVFSNFTPRGVKYMPEQAKEIVVFGIQYTVKYINDLFNENFLFAELRNSPLSDDGTKKSATGLLAVFNGKLKEQCSWDEVNDVKNELKLRFRNGEMFNFTTLTEIRERLNG